MEISIKNLRENIDYINKNGAAAQNHANEWRKFSAIHPEVNIFKNEGDWADWLDKPENNQYRDQGNLWQAREIAESFRYAQEEIDKQRETKRGGGDSYSTETTKINLLDGLGLIAVTGSIFINYETLSTNKLYVKMENEAISEWKKNNPEKTINGPEFQSFLYGSLDNNNSKTLELLIIDKINKHIADEPDEKKRQKIRDKIDNLRKKENLNIDQRNDRIKEIAGQRYQILQKAGDKTSFDTILSKTKQNYWDSFVEMHPETAKKNEEKYIEIKTAIARRDSEKIQINVINDQGDEWYKDKGLSDNIWYPNQSIRQSLNELTTAGHETDKESNSSSIRSNVQDRITSKGRDMLGKYASQPGKIAGRAATAAGRAAATAGRAAAAAAGEFLITTAWIWGPILGIFIIFIIFIMIIFSAGVSDEEAHRDFTATSITLSGPPELNVEKDGVFIEYKAEIIYDGSREIYVTDELDNMNTSKDYAIVGDVEFISANKIIWKISENSIDNPPGNNTDNPPRKNKYTIEFKTKLNDDIIEKLRIENVAIIENKVTVSSINIDPTIHGDGDIDSNTIKTTVRTTVSD